METEANEIAQTATTTINKLTVKLKQDLDVTRATDEHPDGVPSGAFRGTKFNDDAVLVATRLDFSDDEGYAVDAISGRILSAARFAAGKILTALEALPKFEKSNTLEVVVVLRNQ